MFPGPIPGPDYGLTFPFRMVSWEEAPTEPLEELVMMRHGYEIPLMGIEGGAA